MTEQNRVTNHHEVWTGRINGLTALGDLQHAAVDTELSQFRRLPFPEWNKAWNDDLPIRTLAFACWRIATGKSPPRLRRRLCCGPALRPYPRLP